jgi:hypothetical protein
MRNSSVFLAFITVCVVVPSVILFLCAGSASAQISSANYTFVVASGFLCDLGDSGSCPAVAKSANGDSYEISGAGTFDPQSKSVMAAGTFNHKSTNGNVLETGVWTARELVSFVSYGIAPPTMVEDQVWGQRRVEPNRAMPHSGYIPLGGLAILRIDLLPVSGVAKSVQLEMNCALGNVPRERSVEGIRLLSDGSGAKYSEEDGGRVMFLLMRSKKIVGPANSPPKETLPTE